MKEEESSQSHMPWDLVYTQHAIDFMIDNVSSERVLDNIFSSGDLLKDVPELGKVYDPNYAAAKPPFSCRELPVPDTPFTLYYLLQEEKHRVVVFCVEFQRVDPNARFSTFDYSVIEW